MPRISDRFLSSIVFLYSSEEAARRGSGSGGGSGFILGVGYTIPVRRWHHYLVTNRHVIDRGGLWVRVNVGMNVETYETTDANWEKHVTSDVAICHFDPPEEWNFAFTDSTTLLTGGRSQTGESALAMTCS